jgi:hypothetical protein
MKISKKIRLPVRNEISGRIVAFIYYDWATAGDENAPIIAVDDGHTLITGLAIPFENQPLRQFLECERSIIDCSQPKLVEF